MYTGIKHLHSGLAYLVLLGLLIAAIYFLLKYLSGSAFTAKDKKFSLIPMILVHLQALIGLIQLFMSPYLKSAMEDFGGAMKSDSLRLYVMEHPLMMIVAAVLVTIGNKRVKQAIATNSVKQFAPFLFFFVGLLVVLSRIPWSAWLS